MADTQSKVDPVHVLHLEDNVNDHLLVEAMMRDEGMECRFMTVQNRADFESALVNNKFNLIISDFTLPSFDGLSGLSLAHKLAPKIPFIFFSGTIGEESAVESLKKGAVDYVIKHRPHRLVPAIRNALRSAEEQELLEASREQNREQAALLDKARDAILVCDLNNRIVYWNRSAERIYGWTAAEAMGKNVTHLLFEKFHAPLFSETEIMRSLNERGEWVGEMEGLAKDGRPLITQIRAALIYDEGGQPKSLLIISTDVTETKQLEEKFLRAQRMESLGVLVSGVAHDLNNALSPILIGVDILRKNPGLKESVLQAMENSARRGADMVKQMLAFARGNDTKRTRIEVGQLMKEMGKVIDETFPKDVHCQVDVPKDCWPVLAVPTQVYQVLMNLCVNANDAMPKGGYITLTAENVQIDPVQAGQYPDAKPGKYVCHRVADSGCGVTPEQMEKIFQPFFTTKPAGKGTGLGLSTSLDIVRNHGGFMTVTSRVDVGTEFKFYLPAMMEDQPGKTSAAPPLPTGNGECILVVDDEAAVVAVTQTALENFNYRVLTAISGREAIARLDENRREVQLVIVDLTMPFMGSLATAVVLRKVRPEIKLVVVGGVEKEIEADIRERLKADAFLPKPFTMEKLLATVHQVLAGNDQASDDQATG